MSDFQEKPGSVGTRAVIRPHVGEMAFAALCSGTPHSYGMAVDAVSLTSVRSRHAVAPRVVDLFGNQLHMRGSHAIPHPAKMVALLAGWTKRHGEVMRPDCPCATKMKLTVAARFSSGSPYPARSKIGTHGWNRPVFIDFFPKTLFRRTVQRHERILAQEGSAKPAYVRLPRETGESGLPRTCQPTASSH